MDKMEAKNVNHPFSRRLYAMKKHRSKWLHYDLRLEWNGVLLSWALPAELSDSAGAACRAVQTDDHDRRYIRFEGLHHTGPIMLWDRGAWEPHPECSDIGQSLDAGALRFMLHGERLKGQWTLSRTTKRTSSDRAVWTLRRESALSAEAIAPKPLSEIWLTSVESGKTIEDVEREWLTGKKRRDDQATFAFD